MKIKLITKVLNYYFLHYYINNLYLHTNFNFIHPISFLLICFTNFKNLNLINFIMNKNCRHLKVYLFLKDYFIYYNLLEYLLFLLLDLRNLSCLVNCHVLANYECHFHFHYYFNQYQVMIHQFNLNYQIHFFFIIIIINFEFNLIYYFHHFFNKLYRFIVDHHYLLA